MFCDLPIELYYEIFNYLEIKDLFSMKKTNTYFHDIVKHILYIKEIIVDKKWLLEIPEKKNNIRFIFL